MARRQKNENRTNKMEIFLKNFSSASFRLASGKSPGKTVALLA
jgi:hypothetical protein